MKPHFLLLFSLFPAQVWAAACCGGGIAAPALIVGDERAQVTTSYSYSRVSDDVDDDAVWRSRDVSESIETFRIEAARTFADRFQMGGSLPVIRRLRQADSASGFGDVGLNLGYEYLPDWDYNPWRPHGLGYLTLVLPTGTSVTESEQTYQLDARGRGFWAFGAGTLLTKTWGNWDGSLRGEVHRSLAKHYANSRSSGTLHPGYGGDLGLGSGYSIKDWRLGAQVTWTYEDPVDVTGTITSRGSPQRLATLALSVGYLLPGDMSLIFSYSDQTLVGSPSNTNLARAAQIQLQRRWAR